MVVTESMRNEERQMAWRRSATILSYTPTDYFTTSKTSGEGRGN
jgi:hypothetical protein